MLMKTLASKTDRTVFWVSITTLISKFSGESEKLVELLFDMAREYQPSIIVFEEVDSIGRMRKSQEKDSERRFKIAFLQQMDLLAEQVENVSFLGTTNNPWELDTAFLRRFERKILVPLLNQNDREKMLQKVLQSRVDLTKN